MFYVFHHVPKTAGQSCILAFQKLFNVIRDYQKNVDTESLNAYLMNKVDLGKLGNNDLLAGHYNISGHYLYQRYPLLDRFDAKKIIFIRDPFATAISGIKYGIKKGRFKRENAEKIIFDRVGYFHKMLQCDASNYREVIDSYFFVGLVDRIQESFDAFCALVGKDCISIEKKNSTDDVGELVLSSEVVDKFHSINKLDYDIFEYAQSCADRYILKFTSDTGTNPYKNLPKKAFWKLSVASKSLFDIDGLWNPKFNIKLNHKIVTFGSCFAQHIGKALKSRGFNWLSTELPPDGLREEHADLYNYNIFSTRTGNIYTTSLLKQWTEWALGKAEVPTEYWKKDSRFYDPFRPRIEPDGFESDEEMKQSRDQAIKSFRESINKAHYFVFTLGLTESWINKEGYEYPMCPGTVAGDFEPAKHKFKNQQFQEILQNLEAAILLMREENPRIKFILTVSPVPLTATKTNNHVLVATMESKSILRAVAGQLSKNNPFIDYFPSYEIVNSPVFRGVFFESNQRSVSVYGVNFVMDSFFRCLTNKFTSDLKNIINVSDDVDMHPELNDEHCEEALLEAFGVI
jgi:hypothetical protein